MTKMGRKKIDVDLIQAGKLAKIFCTGEEIANLIGVSYDTLVRRIEEEGLTFADWYKKESAEGKASLRRMQWLSAKEGNVTMQIWLGKNFLGQTDKQEIQHSGGTQIRVSVDDFND